MKYVRQFGIIIFISFLGELLNYVVPLPIPASIYGIVLMFIVLKLRIMPIEAVKETGRFLIDAMPLMFVPAAVGLMESWDIIQSSLISYLVITAITTVIVMVVAGRATQAVIRHNKESVREDD